MKMNKLMSFGLMCTAIALMSKHLFTLPEFTTGFLLGLGISLQLVGIVKERFNIKFCLMNKLFGKGR